MLTQSETRSVVFRTTQKCVGSDGWSIIFYSNRTCQVREGDIIRCTLTYTLRDGEAHLIDDEGNTIMAGTYQMSRDGRNLSWVKFNGVTYYKR